MGLILIVVEVADSKLNLSWTHAIDEILLRYHENTTLFPPSSTWPQCTLMYFMQHPAEGASKHLYPFGGQ